VVDVMKPFILTLLTAVPQVASAELVTVNCNFHTECFDTETCQDANYDMSFSRDPQQMETDQVTTEVSDDMSETFKARAFGTPTHYGFTTVGADDTQMLLSVKDGVGRYSIHMLEEGIALFYLGTCKEAVS